MAGPGPASPARAPAKTASSIGRREPAGERVLLARVVRADETVAADRGLRAVPEAWLWPRRRVPAGGQRPERGIPGERAEREHDPTFASSAELPARGTARRCRAPRCVGLLAGGAQRTAAAMYVSSSVRPSSARRDAGRSASPARCSAAHRKSPDASPVKTRPVRLPAVRRRREADEQDARVRVAEARAPVAPSRSRRGSGRPSRAPPARATRRAAGSAGTPTISAVKAASGGPVRRRHVT